MNRENENEFSILQRDRKWTSTASFLFSFAFALNEINTLYQFYLPVAAASDK